MRSRPLAPSPRSARKLRASSSGRAAISASILPHTAVTATLPSAVCLRRPNCSTTSGIFAASSSPRFTTTSSGLAERNVNPRTRFCSSSPRSRSRSGCSRSRAPLKRESTEYSASSSGARAFLRSFSNRSKRFSTTARSERIISSSTRSMSRFGSTGPSGFGTFRSSKARTTSSRASAFFKLVRYGAISIAGPARSPPASRGGSAGRSTYSTVA